MPTSSFVKHALALAVLAATVGLNSTHAADLLQVYQQAVAHDASFQADQEQYAAAKENLPIARSVMLPSLTLSANTAINEPDPRGLGPERYNSNGFTFTITQPLLNLSAWSLYSQADISVAQAAMTFAQAQQQLIIQVATAYFNVLEAQDKLAYAQTFELQLKQQLAQTQQQYKVGLKAMTDVQSTEASYETAVADRISAENALNNAYEQLEEITGTPERNLAPLKTDAPLLKPNPLNPDTWVNVALQNNLTLQAAQLQRRYDNAGISVAKFGNGTIPGYYPTVNLVGVDNFGRNHDEDQGSPVSSSASRSMSGGLQASYTVFNGGGTYYTVEQARYTAEAAQYSEEQAHRQTVSDTRQAYLNVLADISQVQALNQAMISGESSLQAITAAYNVGTRTIVDLLTQQSDLYDTQQQYANARYQYILDSLSLKQASGLLAPSDVVAINQWLQKRA